MQDPTDLDALTDEELVRRLMDKTSSDVVGLVMGSVLQQLQQIGLPTEMFELMRQELLAFPTCDMIPIYLKHYDRQTLIAVVRFHESEAGIAMVRESPSIMKEALAAAQRWSEAAAHRVMAAMSSAEKTDKAGEN